MLKTIVCTFAILTFTITASAQTAKPSGALSDVTGVWIMLVAGHQIGLELEQKGTVVEGEQPADGSPAPHAGGPGSGPITARMLDDGTFEGELSTNRGLTKWTGERLQPK